MYVGILYFESVFLSIAYFVFVFICPIQSFMTFRNKSDWSNESFKAQNSVIQIAGVETDQGSVAAAPLMVSIIQSPQIVSRAAHVIAHNWRKLSDIQIFYSNILYTILYI